MWSETVEPAGDRDRALPARTDVFRRLTLFEVGDLNATNQRCCASWASDVSRGFSVAVMRTQKLELQIAFLINAARPIALPSLRSSIATDYRKTKAMEKPSRYFLS